MATVNFRWISITFPIFFFFHATSLLHCNIISRKYFPPPIFKDTSSLLVSFYCTSRSIFWPNFISMKFSYFSEFSYPRKSQRLYWTEIYIFWRVQILDLLYVFAQKKSQLFLSTFNWIFNHFPETKNVWQCYIVVKTRLKLSQHLTNSNSVGGKMSSEGWSVICSAWCLNSIRLRKSFREIAFFFFFCYQLYTSFLIFNYFPILSLYSTCLPYFN